MIFKKEQLQTMVWEDYQEDDPEGLFIIEDNIVDTTRWNICHTVVFRYKDKFYISSYQVGATEQQDEGPYEYDNDKLECKEVVAEEVKTIKWKVIE